MGPEIGELEKQLADYVGVKHAWLALREPMRFYWL